MTSRLYYADSYLTDFTSTVLSVDGVRMYLDRTAFYPTSGGQPHDLGELGGIRVVDVVDEETRIAHVLATPSALAPDGVVIGRVDRARRFDNMQQHTGQHVLSAVFEELFGYATVSVHFGDVSSSLDLDTEPPARDRAMEAQRCANEIVFENRSVSAGFENAATAMRLRKPSDREGEIRVVTIDDLDRSACGGTHVRTTGEIGSVSIRRMERYKQFTRVEFLCGWRALRRSQVDFDVLARMSATMTASIDELPALVESAMANLRAAEADRRKLGDELARHRARALHGTAVPDRAGVRRVTERAAALEELRALAQAISGFPKVLFAGAVTSPPTVVFAASEDAGVNAGAVLKSALASRGGQGGGSARVAQGTVGDAAVLEAVLAELVGGDRPTA